ncbi:hypothetical protein [Cupriavidus pinatubonensis]|uniref:hypothetical protein n=1 Tax=Cupriavidus pinatubonensis TaxID=248026 RepID=UPI003610B434
MTMQSPVVAIRQVEAPLPPAFAAAVTQELFDKLRLEPVPVMFQHEYGNGDTWDGYCPHRTNTERGEVVMAKRLVETTLIKPKASHIQSVYLHEVAHRLTPDAWHNAAFSAMTLVLYLRAGVTDGAELWQLVSLYDAQDEEDVGTAIAWAWKTANELAPTELSAERCGEVILERYTRWRTWLDEKPQREEARQAAIKAREDATKANEQLVADLRESRYWWAAGAFLFGALAAIALRFL